MKKKTLFKVLPALLIAPILACCITLYANASEADEGLSFFDDLTSFFQASFNNLLNSSISSFDSSNKLNNSMNIAENNTPSNEEWELESDDGLLYFTVHEKESAESPYTCTVTGFGSSWFAKHTPQLTCLDIPTQIEFTIPETTNRAIANVVAIGVEEEGQQGAFTYVQQIEKAGNAIQEIVVNGYSSDGTKGSISFIHSLAFSGWTKSLVSVTLPDYFTRTGFSWFNNDYALRTIKSQSYSSESGLTTKIGLPDSLTTLGENTFADCHSLDFYNGILELPDTLQGTIGLGCFYNCYALKKIIFNTTSVTAIGGGEEVGNGAFEGCTGIEEINFANCKNLKRINGRAFYNCNQISELILPDGIETLGYQSFMDCYELDNIHIPEGTKEIGQQCFSNDTTTATTTTASVIEYLYLPESCMKIQKGAFQNSENLKEVVIGMRTGKTVGAAEDLIADNAFANCPSLISATFLWDLPWQLYKSSFTGTGESEICDDTGSRIQLQVRFRPLAPDMAWLEGYSMKSLDDLFPVGSLLCISAIFCDSYYGNDLENYLEQNGCTQEQVEGEDYEYPGAYDNETFATRNESLNNVKYKEGVSIPDTVTIKDDCTTDKIMKSKTKGTNSKTIDFVYDNTEITQTTYTSGTAKTIERDADDGILDMGNTAIQINVGSKTGTVTTLNVTRTNKNGTKTNPCIYGHTDKSSTSNPFASTYDYLTADTNLMNDVGYPEEKAVREPRLNEHEKSDKPRGLFSANDDPTYDMEVNNACCIFCRSNAILNISNITFGGDLYDPITKKTTPTNNICELGCVYNSGTMTMENCSFENSESTWGSKSTNEASEITSYGGSCVFNFGIGTMTTCVMKNSSAALDGGAVMNVDTLTMTGCTIEGCSAKHFGGAVYDNLGDPSKGGTGKYGILTIDGCTFKGNSAAYGGAIKYRNRSELGPGVQLTLKGSCSFTDNKDLKGKADDLCMGPNYEDGSKTAPFALDGFSLQESSSKVTVSAIRQKAGLILCKGGAKSAGLFLSKNPALEISAGEGDTANDMIFKTTTTTYTLTADDNGHWVEIVDGVETEVTSFTAVGTTPPTAAEKITYKDADGVQHTLTATPTSEEYEFSECTYSETTRTFTATFTAKQQQDVFGKIKTSIKNRNSDAKENAKMEIYAR